MFVKHLRASSLRIIQGTIWIFYIIIIIIIIMQGLCYNLAIAHSHADKHYIM